MTNIEVEFEKKMLAVSPVSLAESIASDFFGNRFDHASRDMPDVEPWLLIPEVGAAQQLRNAGASDRAVRRFLTLVCAVDYQTNSDRLWNAAARLHTTRPDLFEPAQVAAMPTDRLHRDQHESGAAGRFHQRNAKSWQKIAEYLVSGERSAVRRAIDEGVGCVDDLREDLRRYPLLRGEKIGPVWIRIMAIPGKARIAPVESMSVGVDIHLRRLTRNLGLLDSGGDIAEIDASDASRDAEIRRIWRDAAHRAKIEGPSELGGGPGALDPALWFFGRYGCKPCQELARPVRFGHVCDACRFRPA